MAGRVAKKSIWQQLAWQLRNNVLIALLMIEKGCQDGFLIDKKSVPLLIDKLELVSF